MKKIKAQTKSILTLILCIAVGMTALFTGGIREKDDDPAVSDPDAPDSSVSCDIPQVGNGDSGSVELVDYESSDEPAAELIEYDDEPASATAESIQAVSTQNITGAQSDQLVYETAETVYDAAAFAPGAPAASTETIHTISTTAQASTEQAKPALEASELVYEPSESLSDFPDNEYVGRDSDADADEARTVYENCVSATCYSEGSYDVVTYSSRGEELSREHKVIPMADHVYNDVGYAPTCTEPGRIVHTCSICGHTYTAEVSQSKGHSFVCGVCTECGAVDPSVSIPADAAEYRGHRFYVFDSDELLGVYTIDDAERYCRSLGGYLAFISHAEENDICYQQMLAQGYESAYFGITDRKQEGRWQSLYDYDIEYSNWHDGEPNNEGADEDYAMFYWKFTDGTWNDGDFGGNTDRGGRCFICEWE